MRYLDYYSLQLPLRLELLYYFLRQLPLPLPLRN
jgi:hypothetical protein